MNTPEHRVVRHFGTFWANLSVVAIVIMAVIGVSMVKWALISDSIERIESQVLHNRALVEQNGELLKQHAATLERIQGQHEVKP